MTYKGRNHFEHIFAQHIKLGLAGVFAVGGGARRLRLNLTIFTLKSDSSVNTRQIPQHPSKHNRALV